MALNLNDEEVGSLSSIVVLFLDSYNIDNVLCKRFKVEI